MDMNLYVYDVLTAACSGVPVYFEETNFTENPPAYIEFERIYGDERNFADGKALHKYHFYRVNCFSVIRADRQTIMDNVKKSMTAAGFFLQEDNIPVPREANAAYWGAYSEFSYWEVAADERNTG